MTLAILAVVAGLTLPSLSRFARERQREATLERVGALVALARSHAQRAGRAMELRVTDGGRRLEVHRFESMPQERDARFAGMGRPAIPDDARGPLAAADEAPFASLDEDDTLVAEPWSVLALGGGRRVTRTPPEWVLDQDRSAARGAALRAGDEAAIEDELEASFGGRDGPSLEPEAWPMLVVLPDGTLLYRRGAWLRASREDEAVASLEVNSWTGAMAWTLRDPDDDPLDDPAPMGPEDGTPAAPARSGDAAARPRRRRSSRPVAPRVRARRGALLVEVLIALALFVGAGAFTLGALRQGLTSLERAVRETQARDLARAKMAELEAGIVSLADLRDEAAALDVVGSFDFADVPPGSPPDRWILEVDTEPSDWAGLLLVSITVRDADDPLAGVPMDAAFEPEAGETPVIAATVRRLVRVRDEDGEAPELDPLLEGLPTGDGS